MAGTAPGEDHEVWQPHDQCRAGLARVSTTILACRPISPGQRATYRVIGTMNNLGQGLFGAVLPVTTKPSKIRVVSSIAGASATATVK